MYGKIYEQTFRGSMYGSGSHIFAVWSYVIAHTKPDAMVELNPLELASMLGEDVTRIEQAIEHFKSPDPRSRSHEFEGRRLIQKGEYIYFVPQYHKYHGFANDAERRSYFAEKKREQRQRDKQRQTVKSKESKNVQQSDTETDSKTHTKNNGADVDFIEQLKRDPFNTGIDIDRELLRAQKWCRQKGRRCTQRFFEKWVGRADRLVPESKPKTIPSKVILQGTQWEDKPLDESKRAEVSQKMKELQQQMRMPT